MVFTPFLQTMTTFLTYTNVHRLLQTPAQIPYSVYLPLAIFRMYKFKIPMEITAFGICPSQRWTTKISPFKSGGSVKAPPKITSPTNGTNSLKTVTLLLVLWELFS